MAWTQTDVRRDSHVAERQLSTVGVTAHETSTRHAQKKGTTRFALRTDSQLWRKRVGQA